MKFYDVTFFADAPIRLEFEPASGSLRLFDKNHNSGGELVRVFTVARGRDLTERAVAAFNAIMAEASDLGSEPPPAPATADDDLPF